jgi:hypothetical protein
MPREAGSQQYPYGEIDTSEYQKECAHCALAISFTRQVPNRHSAAWNSQIDLWVSQQYIASELHGPEFSPARTSVYTHCWNRPLLSSATLTAAIRFFGDVIAERGNHSAPPVALEMAAFALRIAA